MPEKILATFMLGIKKIPFTLNNPNIGGTA